MKLKRPFLAALAISFALHLVVISGPAWNLPTLAQLLEPDEGPPLEAHLVAHPGPAAVRPAPAKPRKPKPAAPAPAAEEKVSRGVTEGNPLGNTPPAAEPPPPEPVAEPAEPPTQEVAPALPTAPISLPDYLRIEYRVTFGEGGFAIGSAVQEVRHDGNHYSMRNAAETTGIVAVFRPARIVNISEGDIVAGSLRPREFRMERSTGKNESAVLDWAAGEVRIASGKQYPLEPGTQDMLSMFVQLALIDIQGDIVSLPVATAKKVERYDFAVLGEEKIATPRGERRTLHLRNRQPDGKEATEVWLGLDDARLPIKIRHTDRRGDIFDQIAVRIEFEETKEGTR
jgi:hypothetical protein